MLDSDYITTHASQVFAGLHQKLVGGGEHIYIYIYRFFCPYDWIYVFM